MIETQKRTSHKKAHVVCLEIKHATKWNRKWERAMRSLKQTGKVTVDKMIGVYRGTEKLTFDDVEILPVLDFLMT